MFRVEAIIYNHIWEYSLHSGPIIWTKNTMKQAAPCLVTYRFPKQEPPSAAIKNKVFRRKRYFLRTQNILHIVK